MRSMKLRVARAVPSGEQQLSHREMASHRRLTRNVGVAARRPMRKRWRFGRAAGGVLV